MSAAHLLALVRAAARLGAGASFALLVACGGGSGVPEPLPTFDTSAVAVNDPGSTQAEDWQHGAFAQIYVRGYKDSDGDGIGDLRGLIGQLDYLRDLGVRGIWLMPVTASQDHDHGYAVADYRAIEPDYGTRADFDALLREAHARGIGVIVDYVMNHSAYRHPAFTNSRAATDNAFRDWYLWRPSAPSGWSIFGQDPWRPAATGAYFAVFWDQMPDFDLLNPDVLAWHHDNLRWWLNRGVDGFRFDAVGQLVENGPGAWENQPGSLSIMAGVRTLLDGYHRRWMVCEAPGAPFAYADASVCGSAFAFGHNGEIVEAARGDTLAVAKVADYFKTAPAGMSTMLSNHDSFAGRRVWDQLGGNLAQAKLAAATMLLQPGTPFVYYGEEVGMAGADANGLGDDQRLRTPMSWTANVAGFSTGTPFRAPSANIATNNVAAQSADPGSLLNFYKAMIGLRNAWPSIARGSYDEAAASGAALSFQRRLGNETVLVAINYGGAPTTVALARLPAGAMLARAWPAGGADLAVDATGSAALLVPAQSVRVYTHRR